MRLTCPRCGQGYALREALQDDDWRALVDHLVSLPAAVQRPLLDYLALFAPAKQQRLQPARACRLLDQIAPQIRDARVTRNGVSYVVPADTWAAAMRYLVDTPPATLKLPLKSHGYLLQILADKAERLAAADERAREEARRARAHIDAGPVAVGKVLGAEGTVARKGPPPGWRDGLPGGRRPGNG